MPALPSSPASAPAAAKRPSADALGRQAAGGAPVFSLRKWKERVGKAAIAGDAALLKGLLREGLANKADFHAFDADGLHPLFAAARCGHVACVKMLLPHWSPDSLRIDRRTEKGLNHELHPEMTQMYWMMTPFAVAAEHGHLECVKLLLEESDPELPDGAGFTPLMNAVREGHFGVFEFLAQFSDLDAVRVEEGTTALMIAAINAREDFVDALLAMGADPDRVDHDGGSALAHVLRHSEKSKPIAEKLMRATDWSIEDADGETALHLAVMASGFNDWALPLCVREAPAEAFAEQMRKKDSRGLTPLGLACANWEESPSGAEFLLACGRKSLSQEEIDETMASLLKRRDSAASIDALGLVVSDAQAAAAWASVTSWREWLVEEGAGEEQVGAACPRLAARMEKLVLKSLMAQRAPGAQEAGEAAAFEKREAARRPRTL